MIENHEKDYIYIACVEVNPYNEEFDFYFVMKSNYDTAVCRPLTHQNRILVSNSEEIGRLLSLCDEDVKFSYIPPLYELECSISHLVDVTRGENPDYKSLSSTLNLLLDCLSVCDVVQNEYLEEISKLADDVTIDFDIESFSVDNFRKEKVATATFWAWGVICANVWMIYDQ